MASPQHQTVLVLRGRVQSDIWPRWAGGRRTHSRRSQEREVVWWHVQDVARNRTNRLLSTLGKIQSKQRSQGRKPAFCLYRYPKVEEEWKRAVQDQVPKKGKTSPAQ